MKTTLENPKIAEEAANWVISIDAGDFADADSKELALWLRKSPLHIDEFLLAASLFCGLDDIESWKNLSIEELLEKIAPDVIPIYQHAENPVLNDNDNIVSDPITRRRPLLYGMISAAGCLLLAGMLWLNSPATIAPADGPDEAGIYATVLGEQRSIALPDGSVVHVNTLSEIKVDFSKKLRVVNLIQGEAMFEVEHDPVRPFRVVANGTVTEAIGTKFNVRISKDGAKVVVVEGKVAVETGKESLTSSALPAESVGTVSGPSRLADGRMLLTTGQEVILGARQRPVFVPAVNITAATSWRNRQLSFEGDDLQSIVGEFGRYNPLKIKVTDAKLANTKFSGVFNADDPDSFIEFLKLTGDVSVTNSGPDEITLRSNEGR
ncbi:FecR domain-containing protein [Parasphingorhabdus sp.]|uniref:FecR family protein n=1 Tax=Parasphingorhabdus sp. TaxID=2709688 RepID=UPI00326421A0